MKLIPYEKQKLIYLQWMDAYANDNWLSPKEIEDKIKNEGCYIEQIGWIVYEDKKEIHLVARRCGMHKNYSEQFGNYQRIPKTWILKRKDIKL